MQAQYNSKLSISHAQFAPAVGSTPTPMEITGYHQTKQNQQGKEQQIMARTPMVTRTITTTKAIVLCLDIESAEPFNQTVTLPRTYKDEKSLMKQVSKVVDNEKVKAVHVVSKEEVETLYGMTEQEFITLAKPMPPRGANQTDEAEDEQATE